MVWVFGYGSLIWKVGFPFEKRVVGHVQGYKRRFWWWSEDHRGVPGNPGRVVNLLKTDNPEDKVWGVAYWVSERDWLDSVAQQLDYREKGGYTRFTVDFHSAEESFPVTIYLGSVDHRQYAGPDSLEAMARTIATSVGPSGDNTEYLFNLAAGLQELDVVDEHVMELEAAVRKQLKEEQK